MSSAAKLTKNVSVMIWFVTKYLTVVTAQMSLYTVAKMNVLGWKTTDVDTTVSTPRKDSDASATLAINLWLMEKLAKTLMSVRKSQESAHRNV